MYGIWTWLRHEGALRSGIVSVLDDSNSYASYLVLTLSVAWGEWLTERAPWARALSALTLVITLWMFPLAGSRIAIIAATVCAGIAWTTLPRSARARWIRGSVLAAIACLILLFPLLGGREIMEKGVQGFPSLKSWGIQRFAQAMDAEFVFDVWRGGRRAISAAGLRMVGERPVFGQGPGTFVKRLGDFYRPWDEGYKPRHENAHNYFIQVAAETGIVGFVGFLWVVATGLVAAFTRNLNGERVRARLLAAGIVGYLMTAFTGHPLLLSEQAFLFWGSLGILAACTRLGHVAPNVPSVTSHEASASGPSSLE
jgi:O-antigen ligase